MFERKDYNMEKDTVLFNTKLIFILTYLTMRIQEKQIKLLQFQDDEFW